MDPTLNSAPTHAHPETMDFLSRAWCDFAIQTLDHQQPPNIHDRSAIVLLNPPPLTKLDNEPSSPSMRMEKSVRMDEADFTSLPPWKSNDVKSWIWMQQAMHPELNYSSYFKKKWAPWKMLPSKFGSIKKWVKEIKQKRKEEGRLQKAEVHAAISVAGVAAALAAIAAEKNGGPATAKEAAVAAAAALVAAQCAQVAEAMGAKKKQLSTAINSAMSSTNATDVLTLTAAATTSLRGAETLKARTGCRNRIAGNEPVLPIEEKAADNHSFDFEKNRAVLAAGADLSVEMPDGRYVLRSVSITLNDDAKVVLKLRKLNLLKSKKQSIILDLHAELYKEPDADESETCYLIVLSTTFGTVKLDMSDDYKLYKTWAATINHMLTLSTSFSKYQLQIYQN